VDDPAPAEYEEGREEDGEEEREYAAHAHTFERHDVNGDSLLDENEMGEYLVPRSTAEAAHESLQHLHQPELQRLHAALRLGTRAEGMQRRKEGGGEAGDDA
jgi:hypothetical protein